MSKQAPSSEARLQKYEAMIRNLEEYARTNPTGYLMRVRLLHLLGLGYIFLWLGIALALLVLLGVLLVNGEGKGGYILVKLGAGVCVLIYVILRSFWIPIRPSTRGIVLTHNKAPALFALLDDIRVKLNTPPIHYVRLNEDFNASAGQYPRFGTGLLGNYQNYLYLGLPLMETLSPEQFRFVIAHELGHHSRNHSRISRRIYKMQGVWEQLIASFKQRNDTLSILIFGSFYLWYVPYFSAYSFALRRQNEYEADSFAIQYTDTQAGGSALLTLRLWGQRFEEVWSQYYKQVLEQMEVPTGVLLQIADTAKHALPTETAVDRLTSALRKKTGFDDTHPGTKDRLLAIGYLKEGYQVEELVPPIPAVSASEFYFGVELPYIRQELEQDYRNRAAQGWKARYETLQEHSKKIKELEEKGQQTQSLSRDELMHLGGLYEQVDRVEGAILCTRTIIEKEPDYLPAKYQLARMLLESKEEEGMALMEEVMEKEKDYTFSGCQIIYSYLMNAGREEEANNYRSRYLQTTDLYDEMKEERKILRSGDTLVPAEIPADFLQQVREVAATIDRLQEILIVRKEVKISPEKPCIYVYLQVRTTPNGKEGEQVGSVLEELGSRLDWNFPHYLYTNLNHKGYQKRMRQVPNAVVYRRASRWR